MNNIFKNKEHQTFFDKNGFVLIDTTVLNENTIKSLLDLQTKISDNNVQKIDKDFFVGMEHPDKNLVCIINTTICNILKPILDNFTIDYRPFLSNFITKPPNRNSKILPHQDWTFTEDEEIQSTLTCWIPLVDTNLENGCLGLLKGSHLFLNNIRFSPPVSNIQSPLSNHSDWILPYFEWLPMKAGSILFFDYRIFHTSLPNISTDNRIAIGSWLVHKNSTFCHYYINPNNQNELLKYKVDEEFYINYDNFILSQMFQNNQLIIDYEIVERVPVDKNIIYKKQLMKLIKSSGSKFKDLPKSLMLQKDKFDRLKYLFNRILSI
ncbi:MAG: phytanoyl-CoA dioxygenase family protein [Candidatus Sericytochromatia bacterium]